MGSYVPSTPAQRQEMLEAIGLHDFRQLYRDVPEEMLRQAASMAVCKINIDSDLRLAMTASIRKYFTEHPDHFDPRQSLGPGREAIKEMVKHKIVDVLGCDGKA